MIAIVDYGMGNLKSVGKAFERIGADAVVTRDPKVINDAHRVVLPGVGAFKECMTNLTAYGLIDVITRSIESGKPFLGICLGLQLLFDESDEGGVFKGLGIIKGRVLRFPAHLKENGGELKVPHMGWNSIERRKDSLLLDGIPDGSFFYFVHSYYAEPSDPSIPLTTTGYGVEFTSSISKNNILATQFHPEKSQNPGLKVLKNFTLMR
ncbi:MAG: imidazole glycerol phosphate synthase subunit HisH [Deltaproteobacteria bacterium]|nr:imidazole glycerol phosphate synthase subunit HisH [Deltaproteobacteria bacterium]